MRGLQPTAGLSWAWVLALVIAVSGCGHSSDTTGPSPGTTTASSLDFGSNNPRTVSAFGDSITFGVLEERRIRAALETSSNYPNVLQGLLQRLDPAWHVINRGRGGELVQDGAMRIGDVLGGDHPGFILIMEGTNNASRCDDPSFILGNLRTMVHRAKANKTIPLLGTIPPNFRNDPCAHNVIDSANGLIRGLVRRKASCWPRSSTA
jgi:lysophospholipase L1-like esterase